MTERNRQARANTIREEFLDTLRSTGLLVRKVRDLADAASDPDIRSMMLDLGRAGREVYSVSGIGLIHIRVRSEPPGWWNILKTVKNHFDLLSPLFKCYYILLIGRTDQHIADGYIVTDLDQPPFLRQPGDETTKYTVNERQHLDLSKCLLSIDKVARTLGLSGSA